MPVDVATVKTCVSGCRPDGSRVRVTSASDCCRAGRLFVPGTARCVISGSAQAHSGIFISYRRADSAYPAGWLSERLVEHFGRDQVFKDVDSLEPGDDFADAITGAVGSCAALIAVIGEQWLALCDERGRRQLDNPEDFVRLEIETALDRGVRVIPVLVNGASMPRSVDLPPSLQKLARRQAVELRPDHFDTSALIRVLGKAISNAAAQSARPDSLSQTTAQAPARRRTPWTAQEVIAAVAQYGDGAAEIARTVTGWAAAPHLRLAGGTGPGYPSFTVEADSARTTGSRWRGVLPLYASPHDGPPALELRVKRMCRTPPYNRQHNRQRLVADLHALSIPRLDREEDLTERRPEIPLHELSADASSASWTSSTAGSQISAPIARNPRQHHRTTQSSSQ
jgi:hypothetical protein